ncbi:hypothetical protein [Bifidobacterium olomucense]|uniref:Uncharacterized protein n=1 Tax=Bifidobacterium olomucense TaxID=2675324 RepID=A0A7Y0EXD7_9BIFI|nr:hypothetical protein [Bifidobacterium sp. DSM 109959]NMM98172.1 hypothetical protein [Bifidobacterium sp. DSM 109959]
MTVLTDHKRTIDITIREWNEETSSYGPDWSADFFEVGGLKNLGDGIYEVADVQYCIDQANDMVAGDGDYADAGPQPNQTVLVDEPVRADGQE